MAKAVEKLRAARKQAGQECRDRCQQVEDIVSAIDELDFDNDEEIVEWVRVAKDSIKIKEVDDKQA